PQAPGERATLSDWSNHLTTTFPEVRLKRYLEMRGADAGPPQLIGSLPAFWVGLSSDDVAPDGAWGLGKRGTPEERRKLRDDVPRLGLKATIRGRTVRDLARDCLTLAHQGLARRARVDIGGRDEGRHLETLDNVVARGTTAAEELIEAFNGPWGG